MNDHKKIIAKIKKCLALSSSSNRYEAEAALRQASKLMEAHGVDDQDIQAADAEERRAKSGVKSSPSNWESMLAARIGDAFCCRVIFARGNWNQLGEWVFIGCGMAPELAQYAFAVLKRQGKRAREEYIRATLKRYVLATKTRRADLFSEGWVLSVTGKIVSFAGNERDSTAIDAYMARQYPSLGKLKNRNRNAGRKINSGEYGDYAAGSLSGRDAQLNRGVGGADSRLALEES